MRLYAYCCCADDCRLFMVSQQANKKRTVQEENQRVRGLIKAEKKRKEKLASLGIEYDFGGYEVSAVCLRVCVCL